MNCNGVRDLGEPGIEGWIINIHNPQNNFTHNTATDQDGNFCFIGLTFSDWIVYEDQVNGWIQTAPLSSSYRLQLADGQVVDNLEFGNMQVDCSETETHTFEAGSKDDFGAGADSPAAYVSQELEEHFADWPLVGFDESNYDLWFAHTFTGIAKDNCCIVGARLQIRLKALQSSLAKNDRLSFFQGGRTIWSGNIGDLANTNPWLHPDVATIDLDLGNLPGNTLTSVLPALRDGSFDVFVQDDTAVDWLDLDVKYCCASSCCEYIVPSIANNADQGECCFDFGVTVTEGFPCEISTVRMIVYDEPGAFQSIDYTGDGSDSWLISHNVIYVDLNLKSGFNSLGTFCIHSTSEKFRIVFEYYDESSGMWISCDQERIAYCEIKDGWICGIKFEDTNKNGVQDDGEPGLAGFTIKAINLDNNQIVSTVTDGNGLYKFEGLVYAPWRVFEIQKDNWFQTYPTAGYYDIVLKSNTAYEYLNFGNAPICKAPEQNIFIYGEMDDFDPNNVDFPAADPSQELKDHLAGRSAIVGFDNSSNNRHFAHTFREPIDYIGSGCCIIGATLTIQVRTNSSSLSHNDAITFVQDDKVIYSRLIGSLAGVYWQNQGPTTITIDLGDLDPLGTGLYRATSVLPSLLDGNFDFYIQDDTSVDWVALDIQYCCPWFEPVETAVEGPAVEEPGNLVSSMLTPNPATDNLSLTFSLESSSLLQFEIVNLMGQSLISVEQQDFNVGAHALNFNVQELGPGTYFVRVRSSSGWSESLPFSIVR